MSSNVYDGAKDEADLLSRITHPDLDRTTAMNTYKKWAETYDKDLAKLDYQVPQIVALKTNEFLERKDARILDIAAGTGLVGLELRKLGYTKLDALDGSQEMLDKAKVRGVYDRMYCCMLGQQYTVPIETNTYDCLTIGGAFVPGHMKGDSLPELIRITKAGGLIIALISEKYHAIPHFQRDVIEPIYQAQDQGLVTLVERQVVANSSINNPAISYTLKVM